MRKTAMMVVSLGLAASLLLAAAAMAQRKRIQLDELIIEGNIQKPEAFFILPRTHLNYQDLERRADLKSRIVEAIEKEPF